MAKELRCNDVMPGCDFVARGENEQEVLAKGAEHAKNDHGIEQMDEATAQKVKAAIRDV